MSSPQIIRILVLSYGAAVGKSSLVSRFLHDEFDERYAPTTGDIQSKSIEVDGEPVIIQILDTSGDPRLSEVVTESMKFADAFMVVYDSSDATSLTSCLPIRFSIMQEKQTMTPAMVLVGTKSDLKRQVRRASGRALADTWDCPFVETSAKNNLNVSAPFEQLVREHRVRRRPVVHERKLSTFLSNAFPMLRSWDSTSEQYGRKLKSGWIHKRGLVRQNWKFRYMHIYDDGSLQYFAEEDDSLPLGELNLSDVWQIVDYREHGHEDAFVLQTKDRDWYFSCATSSEKDAWLDVIVRMIAHFASKGSIDFSDAMTEPVRSESDVFFEKRLSLSLNGSNSTASSGLESGISTGHRSARGGNATSVSWA